MTARSLRRPITLATGIALAAAITYACSWSNPVWPKSKKSDAPLFRFTIYERNGTGYIDRDGNIVIPPTLDSSYGNYGDDDFFNGLAKVQRNKETWFIDPTGKPLFRGGFFTTGHFSEGLATSREENRVGYIDREGKLAIPRVFDSASGFSEGLAVVGVNNRDGYINQYGNFDISPRFIRAMSFSEGAARVVEEGQCRYTGYGPCAQFDPITLPYDPNNRRPPIAPRCRYSFIDKHGQRLFETKYPDAKDFAEGLAPVGDGTHWGFIDKRGTVVIPIQYENAEPFSEGLARVLKGGKWGYIDRAGTMVIPASYRTALEFSEGMAVVGDGAYKSWYIDKQGRQAIPGTFTAASNFVLGRAHIRHGVDYYSAKWSYIDRTGRAIFTYSDQSNRNRNNR